jgi:transcription initiation factor IIE alpha subunit
VDVLAAASGEQGWTFAQIFSQLRRQADAATAVVMPPSFLRDEREKAKLRAALLVLWQHSIVEIRLASPASGSLALQKPAVALYALHPRRAVYLGGPRAAQALAFIKKAVNGTAAAIVETLLCRGKARTIDLIQYCIQDHFTSHGSESEENTAATTIVSPEPVASLSRDTITNDNDSRESVIKALIELVKGGFVQEVKPLQPQTHSQGRNLDYHSPLKKQKIRDAQAQSSVVVDEDELEFSRLLEQNSSLPPDTVWRIHWEMIHASLRATCLGRLVNEIHAPQVKSAGSFVTAALRYQAAVENSPAGQEDRALRNLKENDDESEDESLRDFLFTPVQIASFLPKPIQQTLEKEEGGLLKNLQKTLLELSELTGKPRVVRRAGHDLFQVMDKDLLRYWKTRVVHQLVSDRHGAKAARIISILLNKGWLEAETLAHFTMVPVKDTRAILHVLYESGYVDIFPLYTSGATKQQQPSNAIYLWKAEQSRLHRIVQEQIAVATLNLRLRRGHQVEEGKTFIERAHQEIDENENAADQSDMQKFTLGLERLDVALQQLDETLMVLSEF